MKTNITLSLDKRRPKKDGSCAIIFRLSHYRKTISIQSGFSISPSDWNEKKREINKSSKASSNITRLNNLLMSHKSEMIDRITKLDDSGELSTLSIKELKQRLIRQNSEVDFFEFTNSQVESMLKAQKNGNARTYKFVASAMRSFHTNKSLSFRELNYDFLKKLETHHLAKGNSVNGLSVYMRTIRAIYNKAVYEGYAERDKSPFLKYKIKQKPTAKRAIPIGDVKELLNLKVDGDRLNLAKDLLAASFYLMGANFKDLALLDKDQFRDGRLTYQRSKTGGQFNIAVIPSLLTILERRIKQTEGNYIFPIVKRESAALISKDIEWARKRFNQDLKVFANKAGIESNLTSYVIRHSFASYAKESGVEIQTISQMLGHQDIKTTQIYLSNISQVGLDEANSQLMDF